MTALDFLLVFVAVCSIVLQGVVLLELRNLRHTLIAQGNQRRAWNRKEHTVD